MIGEEFDATNAMDLEEYLAWCRGDETTKRRLEAEQELLRPYRDAARRNREEFPDGCGLCGEPADAEMGEFYDPNDGKEDGSHRHVIAHAQCGLDAGMEIA